MIDNTKVTHNMNNLSWIEKRYPGNEKIILAVGRAIYCIGKSTL